MDATSPSARFPQWAGRVLSFVAILALLVTVWEGYKVVAKGLDTIWPVRPDNKSMPHVWDIVGELFEARRAGDDILLLLLVKEALFTFREAAVGFVAGVAFGFGLAVVFERSKLFERSLMPYVVMSQTIPLVAIAPIIVVWGGRLDWPTWIPPAIIAAYLSFFPVTINTLRGLRSPAPTSMELMRSYAASKNETLWKVQVPAALPYIFTALKVAATASVIGALVGELPSSLDRGLGRALLTFTYTFISAPEKLFAAVIISALLGIFFVSLVTYGERLALPTRRRLSG
jgi:NitT/TauT family transport system permease protein